MKIKINVSCTIGYKNCYYFGNIKKVKKKLKR